MEPISLIALSTLALKITSVIKYLAAKDWSASLTQVIAWFAGIVVALVASQADLTAALEPIAGHALGDMDFWSVVLVGMGLASLGSTTHDAIAAVNSSDTSSEPSLRIGGSV